MHRHEVASRRAVANVVSYQLISDHYEAGVINGPRSMASFWQNSILHNYNGFSLLQYQPYMDFERPTGNSTRDEFLIFPEHDRPMIDSKIRDGVQGRSGTLITGEEVHSTWSPANFKNQHTPSELLEMQKIYFGRMVVSRSEISDKMSKTVGGRIRNLFDTLSSNAPNGLNLVLIHDDIEVPAKEIKLSYGSSAQGHQAVKSIQEAFVDTDQEIARIRLGVGRPWRTRDPKRLNFYLDSSNAAITDWYATQGYLCVKRTLQCMESDWDSFKDFIVTSGSRILNHSEARYKKDTIREFKKKLKSQS
ncbi:uncharacterized protein V2V93DRAFT_369933 [Kockiozyma suomiensis]|uniref:uncharacterized protein n=1 Tax=Kockiozyma suomiensis TaxID=1337062 RepID=UPI0033437472